MPVPLAVQAGIALAPTAFSAFGEDPQERLRRELAAIFSPERLGQFAQQHFKTITGGPGYTMARNYAIAGSNTMKNSLTRSLEARGLGTTGIASIASAAADSSLGLNLGRIDASAYDQSLDLARDSQRGAAAALTAAPYGTSRFAASFGRGLEAFMPILRDYLSKRFAAPGSFTGNDVAEILRNAPWGGR